MVNCAGVANAVKTVGRDKETKEPKLYPMNQFELAIGINLVGTFRCISRSAYGMVGLDAVSDEGERGCIINTASVAAEDGQIGQAAYSASKGGVLAMALPIARDLMNDGVRVNTILPGIFEDPDDGNDARNKCSDALAAQVPFPKRLGTAEEYARLAIVHRREQLSSMRKASALDGGITDGTELRGSNRIPERSRGTMPQLEPRPQGLGFARTSISTALDNSDFR